MLRVITVASALFLFSTFCAQGQLALKAPKTIPKNVTTSMGTVITPLDVFNTPMEDAAPIKGTPYLSDNYAKAKFVTTFGSFDGVEARYDIFNDHMEFKEGDSVFAIKADQIVQRVELAGKTFVVDSYEFKGHNIPGYFELIETGKLMLMTKMQVTLRERQPGRAMQPEGSPARYDRMPDDYYFKVGNQNAIRIKSVQKMIEALPDHQRELQEFAKKEKISAKNQSELARLVQYYNSLR